jgi:hypothetical protein
MTPTVKYCRMSPGRKPQAGAFAEARAEEAREHLQDGLLNEPGRVSWECGERSPFQFTSRIYFRVLRMTIRL